MQISKAVAHVENEKRYLLNNSLNQSPFLQIVSFNRTLVFWVESCRNQEDITSYLMETERRLIRIMNINPLTNRIKPNIFYNKKPYDRKV